MRVKQDQASARPYKQAAQGKVAVAFPVRREGCIVQRALSVSTSTSSVPFRGPCIYFRAAYFVVAHLRAFECARCHGSLSLYTTFPSVAVFSSVS